METNRLKVVVAHGSNDTRRALVDAIGREHEVLCDCDTLADARRVVRETGPDLLVIGVKFSDGDGIDLAVDIGRQEPLPTVVVTTERSLEAVHRAMEDHVMAYLIEPVVPADVHAAIIVATSRYEQLRALREEVQDLKLALQQRKIIERAKGMLMAERGISESEAFAELRRRAQNERRTIAEVAEDFLNVRD